MKIIFFPFTHIRTHLAEQLFQAAGPFHLMIPLDPTEDLDRLRRDGLIHLLHPYPEIDPSVQAALEETLAWAAGLTEKEIRHYISSAGVHPFFPDPSVHDIRSAIVSPSGAPKKTDDGRFRDKLFLSLAHRLDQQQLELTIDLQALVDSETELSRWLSEEGPESDATPRGPESETMPDPFELKMGDRLRAWARLANAIDGFWGKDTPSMLITDSREGFEVTVDTLRGQSDRVQRFFLPAVSAPADGFPLQSRLDAAFQPGGDPKRQSGEWEAGSSTGSEDEDMMVTVWDAGFRSPASVLGELAGVDVRKIDLPPEQRIGIGHIRWRRGAKTGPQYNNIQ